MAGTPWHSLTPRIVRQLWLVPVAYLERSLLGHLMDGTIVSVFSEREFSKLITLPQVAVGSEVVFQWLVLAFSLPIYLRIKRSAQSLLNKQMKAESRPKFATKYCSPIGDCPTRGTENIKDLFPRVHASSGESMVLRHAMYRAIFGHRSTTTSGQQILTLRYRHHKRLR